MTDKKDENFRLFHIDENYLKKMIEEIIDEKGLKVKKEDAEEIVMNIMPHLDNLASTRIKQHFIEIADFIKKKFEGE